MSSAASFSSATLQRIAEDKLRSAIERGDFENLPGLGQPAEIIDQPYHPLWWIGRKLRHEQLAPRQPEACRGFYEGF